MARKPKYAVVVLGENADVGGFFNLLISNGYSNVTFLNSLSEHTEVKKLLKEPVLGKQKFTRNDILSVERDEITQSPQATATVKSKGRISLPSSSEENPRLKNGEGKSEIRTNPMYRTTRTMQGEDCYISCKLCDNKIMCTRLSNLTNHVRRHAAAKQFQCVYCSYQHNEPAKVRYHMAHQHNDSKSQPQDNLTPEMQQLWADYMEKCFPDYDEHLKAYQSREDNTRSSSNSVPLIETFNIPTSTAEPLNNKTSHACLECGETISSGHLDVTHEQSPLLHHILTKHSENCHPYECGECSYQNAEQWKVRLHITSRHPMIAADVDVVQCSTKRPRLFLAKFFPSTEDIDGVVDSEEEYLVAELHKAGNAVHSNGIELNWNQTEAIAAEAIMDFASTVEEEIAAGLEAKTNHKSREPSPEYCKEKEEDSTICCSVCGMLLDLELLQLMAHAKRHYHLKQFECQHCPYANDEEQGVREHIQTKHSMEGDVIDHNGELMQKAWMQVMKKCFPDITKRFPQPIDQKAVELPSVKQEPEKEQKIQPSERVLRKKRKGSDESNDFVSLPSENEPMTTRRRRTRN